MNSQPAIPKNTTLRFEHVTLALAGTYVMGAIVLGWIAGRNWMATFPWLTLGFFSGLLFWVFSLVFLFRIVRKRKEPHLLWRIGALIVSVIAFPLGIAVQSFVQERSRTSMISNQPIDELRKICLYLMDQRKKDIASGRVDPEDVGHFLDHETIPEAIARLHPKSVLISQESVEICLAGSGIMGSDDLVVYRPGHEPSPKDPGYSGRTRLAEGVYRVKFHAGMPTRERWEKDRNQALARAGQDERLVKAIQHFYDAYSPESFDEFLKVAGPRQGEFPETVVNIVECPWVDFSDSPGSDFDAWEAKRNHERATALLQNIHPSAIPCLIAHLELADISSRPVLREVLLEKAGLEHVPQLCQVLEANPIFPEETAKTVAEILSMALGEQIGPQEIASWWKAHQADSRFQKR